MNFEKRRDLQRLEPIPSIILMETLSTIPKAVLQENVIKVLCAMVRRNGGRVHITQQEMIEATSYVIASVHPEGGIELVVAHQPNQNSNE